MPTAIAQPRAHSCIAWGLALAYAWLALACVLCWNDATKTRLQPPITIGNEENPDFWKPFNSLAGYLIAGRGLSVSQVFDWETDQQWHHVAVSWNNVDGEVRVWIDGSNSSDVFASALPAPHGIGKTLLGQKTL